jgi:hypothetical protein
MPHQHRAVQTKSVNNTEYVRRQALRSISFVGATRRTVSAARYAVDVVRMRKFRSKVVEDVCCIPEPGQQHHRPTGAAPIEYFQLNVLINGYRPRVMRGWILPIRSV